MEDSNLRGALRMPTTFELSLSDTSYFGLPRGYLAFSVDDSEYDTKDLDDLPEIVVY